MDGFFARLIARAATVDELLSDAFEPLPGQKGDADRATQRLAAWCRSCASGDWSLFDGRLERDGLSLADVLARLATVRHRASGPPPAWIDDAIWIEAALQSPRNIGEARAASLPAKPPAPKPSAPEPSALEPVAFEHLLVPLVEQAETKLWVGLGERAAANLSPHARAGLRHALLKELSSLCAPALYERFGKARKAAAAAANADQPNGGGAPSQYDRFVADLKAGGFRRLFEDKPVLLRLIATIARQWIDTTREFVLRLDSDLATLRRDILHRDVASNVAGIEGDLSDPHNGGHSVLIVAFEDGSRVVYKPKDLRLDVAWQTLVERLNRAGAPVELKAVRTIARDGYGWSEFIDHAGCADAEGCRRFFRRAGAWLALFHCFAGSDMHQENMLAAGDHPVPIDLEMILQASAAERRTEEIEAQAFEAAMETIDNSVMAVGLLPGYGRSPDNKIFAIGGMTSDWRSRTELAWNDINSDTMRPAKTKQTETSIPNLPHVDGRYAKFGDHIDDFVAGFEDYARFLLALSRDADQGGLFDGFAGLPVRKVLRPTRFYYMLLQRLKDHRTMHDGAVWSAQADFLARLAGWERNSDPLWPLQRAERAALLALNVPHFVSSSDDNEIREASGISIRSEGTPGLERASARVRSLDEQEIVWQVEVIRQNTAAVSRSTGPAPIAQKGTRALRSDMAVAPTRETFLAEADKIAADLTRCAIRKGPGAAWIGLDWLGDSEVAQLVAIGADLYNGASGIALFLAAHAAVTGSTSSRELALAAVANLRKSLSSRNAARLARSMGTGGATGIGSVVYALAVMAKCLADDDLLADAHVAASLFSDDLIAADKQLDVIGGCAGGILGLLRLYRDTSSADVLARAQKCGDHLLAQRRVGQAGKSWAALGGGKPLNGFSHGAAGFAYALASLAAETGREEFADAARECIAFENSSYDAQRNNWPDFRGDEGELWPFQWCNGAPGIGMARAAMAKRSRLDSKLLADDVGNALAGVERGWPGHVDTLCCGTLGSVEFYCAAADALGRDDLRERAAQRTAEIMENAAATGDYLWNVGKRQFNLGLFRGLAGVGYTLLRRVDGSLPNVLIWE